MIFQILCPRPLHPGASIDPTLKKHPLTLDFEKIYRPATLSVKSLSNNLEKVMSDWKRWFWIVLVGGSIMGFFILAAVQS